MSVANRHFPIAVMSFNRPHYLEAVLHSLKAQAAPIAPDEIFLFQDGYRSKQGADLTDPRLIERCAELFERAFPESKIFASTDNLGVALNFARAELFVFDELKAEAAFFFEDDMVLSPHYLSALYPLADVALNDRRIAYVAAYGHHRATLTQQMRQVHRLIPMHHKWAFATTRRQWEAQRDIVEPYLEIVSRADYPARDEGEIRAYFRKLGFGSEGTGQDAMKDAASCVLGTTKIKTFACLGKYIGEVGVHSRKPWYDQQKFAYAEIYPGEISTFESLSSRQLDQWIAKVRAKGKHALRLG
jgi:hypothetical protein